MRFDTFAGQTGRYSRIPFVFETSHWAVLHDAVRSPLARYDADSRPSTVSRRPVGLDIALILRLAWGPSVLARMRWQLVA